MKHHFVNCKNYFNEESLAELEKILETGDGVGIYIDCIGHTRTEMETARYVHALRAKYGDRLAVSHDLTFYPVYCLKDAK